MDEWKGKSAVTGEWMRELLPEGAADVGMCQYSQCTSAEIPNTYQLSADYNTYPCKLSRHQVVQASTGCNLASLMVKQEPFNVLEHSGQTTLQKLLETQSGIVPERIHPILQMPAFHQSQNLTMADQLKPGNQAQAMLLGPLQASSDATPQVDMTGSNDWYNRAWRKIQQMKEMHLSDIQTLHFNVQEIRLRANNVETVNYYGRSLSILEKIIKFLNTPRSDLFHWRKEKLYHAINDVVKYVYRFRHGNFLQVKQTQQVEASSNHLEPPHQIQQMESYLQPPGLSQASRLGGPLSLPQASLNSLKVSSSMANTTQYNNLMKPTQTWAPQGNVVPSHRGSQTGFDQRALRMLLYPSTGVSQHNNPCASQQTVASSRNIFNSLEYSGSPIAQMSPVSMSPLNNQQDQEMKKQKMKQPVQQLVSEKKKQQMLQNRNDDTKLRHFVGFSQSWSPVLPPSSSSFTVSPQNSQQSSSQLELKDLSKFSKSVTTSLSASPSALPSPLTPLTPSSNPEDSVKNPLIEESIKLAKTNPTLVHLPLQDKNQIQVAIDTQRLTKSCLNRESTYSGDKPLLHDKGEPLKRLVEVVKTISSKALNASLRDMNAVTTLTDRIAGHVLCGDPSKFVFHDLADEVSNPDNGMSSLEYRTDTKPRMKHELDSVALNDSMIELEFYERGRIKKLKLEPINLLLQEIKEINKKLVEVVVDVMNVEDFSGAGSDEGTLLRCSYIPIGLSKNIKTPETSKLTFPNLPLDLIVSADYPNSSPTVLENMPSGFSDCEEGKYLWIKAKSSFGLSQRKLSHPISVKDIAEAWDVCAREVFHEFAEQIGGGNFSSTYGKWENIGVSG